MPRGQTGSRRRTVNLPANPPKGKGGPGTLRSLDSGQCPPLNWPPDTSSGKGPGRPAELEALQRDAAPGQELLESSLDVRQAPAYLPLQCSALSYLTRMPLHLIQQAADLGRQFLAASQVDRRSRRHRFYGGFAPCPPLPARHTIVGPQTASAIRSPRRLDRTLFDEHCRPGKDLRPNLLKPPLDVLGGSLHNFQLRPSCSAAAVLVVEGLRLISTGNLASCPTWGLAAGMNVSRAFRLRVRARTQHSCSCSAQRCS